MIGVEGGGGGCCGLSGYGFDSTESSHEGLDVGVSWSAKDNAFLSGGGAIEVDDRGGLEGGAGARVFGVEEVGGTVIDACGDGISGGIECDAGARGVEDGGCGVFPGVGEVVAVECEVGDIDARGGLECVRGGLEGREVGGFDEVDIGVG